MDFLHATVAQIQAVDAGFLKDFVIVILAGIGGFAGVASIITSRRKQQREVSFSAELVDKPTCALHREEIARRLRNLEEAKGKMWDALTKETEAIRAEMRKGFADTERALGRIEGELKKK